MYAFGEEPHHERKSWHVPRVIASVLSSSSSSGILRTSTLFSTLFETLLLLKVLLTLLLLASLFFSLFCLFVGFLLLLQVASGLHFSRAKEGSAIAVNCAKLFEQSLATLAALLFVCYSSSKTVVRGTKQRVLSCNVYNSILQLSNLMLAVFT